MSLSSCKQSRKDMNVKQKQEEFLKLLEPVRKNLSGFTMAITRNREEAKDLASETILKAYENFEKLRDRSAFKSWLFASALRINMRRRIRAKIFGDYSVKYAESIPAAESSPETGYDVEILYRAMAELPSKQREAIALFEISGFSIEEIRQLQGGTLSGVKSRLKRGREKLAELLNDDSSSRFAENMQTANVYKLENAALGKSNLSENNFRASIYNEEVKAEYR